MSSLYYFYQAFIVGFVIAAIIGPIGVMCIKKTLESGFMYGLSVGIGACFGDAIYAFIGGVGVSTVSSFLIDEILYIKIVGGLLLLYLGYAEMQSKPSIETKNIKPAKQFFKIIMQSFLLTIASPMTILSFVAIFASIAGEKISIEDTLFMVFGISLGSLLWFVILSGAVAKVKHKLSEKWMNIIRYSSVIILIGFGLLSIVSAFI